MRPLIKVEEIFPLIQIITCIGAAIVYGIKHDWGRVAYWSAASVITVSATYWLH